MSFAYKLELDFPQNVWPDILMYPRYDMSICATNMEPFPVHFRNLNET